MAILSATDFTVKTDNLQSTQLVERTLPTELESNQVLLEIDTFSFTSNNITYGVVGDRMNYWKFFPTQEGYGIIPAWGFANVIESNHPDIEKAQRYYGYYPMSTHLLVTLSNVSKYGFIDASEHRSALPGVYNYYTMTTNDPMYTLESEAVSSIFRPLFITSFLLDDHLAEEHFFGATQILLTSASSKTAQSLAFLLAQRKQANGLNVNLVGLTSSKNEAFVEELGWYDQVVTYDQLSELNTNEKFVVVDFTGNHETQYQLQTLLADRLVYNSLVGLVDWQHLKGEQQLPKKGEFFFAPTYAEKRQEDWGAVGFQQKIGESWQQFASAIALKIEIKQYNGPEQLKQLYLDMLNGRIDPRQGNVVRLMKG